MSYPMENNGLEKSALGNDCMRNETAQPTKALCAHS